MLPDQRIDELLRPATEALREAARQIFALGYRAGSQATVEAIMSNATALLPGTPPTSESRSIDAGRPTSASVVIPQAASERRDEVVRRAPRGLVDDALEHVLQAHPGMTQEEVEAAVTDYDSRIATKSVYNKLRSWEKSGMRFRRHRGLWYRIADIPPPWAEQSSPKGETGGVEPPASLQDIL